LPAGFQRLFYEAANQVSGILPGGLAAPFRGQGPLAQGATR